MRYFSIRLVIYAYLDVTDYRLMVSVCVVANSGGRRIRAADRGGFVLCLIRGVFDKDANCIKANEQCVLIRCKRCRSAVRRVAE